MWYSYKLDKLEKNKIQYFFNDLRVLFEDLFFKNEIKEQKLYKIFKDTKFKEHFDNIKNEYDTLNDAEQKFIMEAFRNNISIEKICCGDVIPISYEKISKEINENISKQLKIFFAYLYDKFIKIKKFKNEYFDISEYYKELKRKEVVMGICPFCGISEFHTEQDKARDPFDHYLAKSKYPFISVYYGNLVVMCSNCNGSSYKGEKDLLSYKKKIFYPYTKNIKNKLSIKNIDSKKNIELYIENEEKYPEIEVWEEVFHVKDRNKNKLKEEYGYYFSRIDKLHNNSESLKKTLEIFVKIAEDTNKIRESAFYKYYLNNFDELKNSLIDNKGIEK